MNKSRLLIMSLVTLYCSVALATEEGAFYLLEQEEIDMARTPQYEESVRHAIATARQSRLGVAFEWQTSQHGNTYYYLSRLQSPQRPPVSNIETHTHAHKLATHLDRDVINKFLSITASAVRERKLFVLEHTPEFDYLPGEPLTNTKFNYIDIVQVHASRVTEFKQATKRTIAALGKGAYPIGFNTFQIIEGAPNTTHGPSYYLISPYITRSHFYEKHPLVDTVIQAIGKTAALDLFAGQQQNLVSGHSFDHIRRFDLSYQVTVPP